MRVCVWARVRSAGVGCGTARRGAQRLSEQHGRLASRRRGARASPPRMVIGRGRASEAAQGRAGARRGAQERKVRPSRGLPAAVTR